ncbi:MAG: L-histidine N(alpha)-methyltransferase, partial [Chloroflexi bacterium]|nr:L-histidine N(alpha)-methyltransferase [Chloroflexota bacterium]
MTQEAERTVDRLQIDVYVNDDGMLDTMADEVRDGLTSSPKQLSPKYFYDAVGSQLFEQITELPEYYPTRAERELLADVANEVMDSTQPVQLVELGSGSSTKTRILLDTSAAQRALREYVPFDVSKAIIDESAASLLQDYPSINIHGVVGDFFLHLDRIPAAQGPRLVLFLGGTIGNLHSVERLGFLQQVKELLGPEDKFLIGVDLVKDRGVLEAAYNDASGVTAAFNKNMLSVLNRGLDADFNADAFDHRAFFNSEGSRIEMHLVPRSPQQINVRKIGLQVSIAPPETLWTESSYKFTEPAISAMLAEAGLQIDRLFTND